MVGITIILNINISHIRSSYVISLKVLTLDQGLNIKLVRLTIIAILYEI